jgi:sigma-B regulation protein RsbU (phosphoserine phosphatase)
MSKHQEWLSELESLKVKSKGSLSEISDSGELVEKFLDIMNEALVISNSVYGVHGAHSVHGNGGKIIRIGVTTISENGIISPIRIVRKKALSKKMYLDTFFLLPLERTSLGPLLDSMKGDYINDMAEHLRNAITRGRISLSSQICTREGIQSNMRFPYRTHKNRGFIFFSADQKGMFNDLLLEFTQGLIKVFETSLEVCNDLDALILYQEQVIKDKGAVTESPELLGYIQKKLEPDENPFPDNDRIEIFHRCFPWEGHPSGDLLNVWRLDEGKYAILVSDVTGHGKESALITIFLRGFFLKETEDDPSPSVVMDRVHRQLRKYIENNFANAFVYSATTIYGIIDTRAGTFTYCNAGHNPQFHIMASKKGAGHEEMSPTSMPLGMPFDETYDRQILKFEAKCLLAFYTDGITEAMNASSRQFGRDEFLKLLKENREKPVNEIGETVLKSMDEHMDGAPAKDDATLMLLRINEIG